MLINAEAKLILLVGRINRISLFKNWHFYRLKNTNQVKNKKYHTVGTVPKYSRKIEETVANGIK